MPVSRDRIEELARAVQAVLPHDADAAHRPRLLRPFRMTGDVIEAGARSLGDRIDIKVLETVDRERQALRVGRQPDLQAHALSEDRGRPQIAAGRSIEGWLIARVERDALRGVRRINRDLGLPRQLQTGQMKAEPQSAGGDDVQHPQSAAAREAVPAPIAHRGMDRAADPEAENLVQVALFPRRVLAQQHIRIHRPQSHLGHRAESDAETLGRSLERRLREG